MAVRSLRIRLDKEDKTFIVGESIGGYVVVDVDTAESWGDME